MKSKKNLVFLGMMGSGKSSIGSLIAKKLQLNFIDIDNVIENELGLSIKKIFEIKGENFFKQRDKKRSHNKSHIFLVKLEQ
jgi:shikimate kinase/shikimate kinase/3-dehydroquinate synthase